MSENQMPTLTNTLVSKSEEAVVQGLFVDLSKPAKRGTRIAHRVRIKKSRAILASALKVQPATVVDAVPKTKVKGAREATLQERSSDGLLRRLGLED